MINFADKFFFQAEWRNEAICGIDARHAELKKRC